MLIRILPIPIQKLEELAKTPVDIKDSTSLFVIHKFIFQDVYEWAGKKRTVEISKGGRQFFPISHFDTALSFIDKLVAEYRSIDKNDKKKNAQKLAEILDNVNYLHPFREGTTMDNLNETIVKKSPFLSVPNLNNKPLSPPSNPAYPYATSWNKP